MYEKPAFIKETLAQFEPSGRSPNFEGIIPHLKVCVATHSAEVDDDTVIYFGSHNFTASAWGKYEKEGSTIAFTNTELGVVFPCKPGSAALKRQIVADLPFKYPPLKFPKGVQPFFRGYNSG